MKTSIATLRFIPVCFLIIFCSTVTAQYESDESAFFYPNVFLSFKGGLSIPISPDEFTKNFKSGNCYGIDLELPLSESNMSFGISYNSNKFGFDGAGAKEFFTSQLGLRSISKVNGPDCDLWSIAGIIKFNPEGTGFFLGIGIGYFKLTRGKVNVTGIDPAGASQIINTELISKDGAYVNMNLGAYIWLNKNFSLIAEIDGAIAPSSEDEATGYIVYYSTGGSEIQRKNTMLIGLKTGLRISL